MALADAGHAVMPGFPADLFLNWSMLVAALGGKIAAEPELICDETCGRKTMDEIARWLDQGGGSGTVKNGKAVGVRSD